MSWLRDKILGIRQILSGGAPLPLRAKLNFIGATVADNPAQERTDVIVGAGAGGSGTTLATPDTLAQRGPDGAITNQKDGIANAFFKAIRLINATPSIAGAEERPGAIAFEGSFQDGASSSAYTISISTRRVGERTVLEVAIGDGPSAVAPLFRVGSDGALFVYELLHLLGASPAAPGQVGMDTTSGRLLVHDGAGVRQVALVGDAGSGSSLWVYTGPAGLAVRDLVHVLPDGTIAKATCAKPCRGLVAAVLGPTSYQVQREGVVGGFAGLTPGETYHQGTDGKVSVYGGANFPAAGSGLHRQEVGFALDSSSLALNLGQAFPT